MALPPVFPRKELVGNIVRHQDVLMFCYGCSDQKVLLPGTRTQNHLQNITVVSASLTGASCVTAAEHREPACVTHAPRRRHAPDVAP